MQIPINTDIARTIDLFALAFALGTTLWFFFIQSPVLIKRMGRDKFVPLQMRLTRVLFKCLYISLLVMFAAALAANAGAPSLPVVTAAIALLGAVVNNFLIIPRALRAGARSIRDELKPDQQSSVERFVSEGGGASARFWHRAVVLFVIVMLAGLLPHAVSLSAIQS